jgi:hypothetical protein
MPGQQIHHRRLPAAVGSDDPVKFTGDQGNADIVDYFSIRVIKADMVQFKRH